MRLHLLEIQAFGPFADRQHVDFDALSDQGLFLLNGPTGAGKSSVLDAVCFALYGSVPGARQAAKRLRSDHAAESVAPEVCLEFSVGDRRFRVVRSPSWERPARRGSGTTTEQARTLLSERVDGDWVQKSARNDEAGLELQQLLGMDKEQFTKVVMLPQGEFAAFLRADAKPRRELLQRLFSTTRFEDLERLFLEESHRSTRALEEEQANQRHVYLRAVDEAQRHGVGVEGTVTVSAGASPPAPDPATGTHGLTEAVRARWEEASAESTELAEGSALADGALAAVSRRRSRSAALARLRAQRTEHQGKAEAIARSVDAVRRHDEARALGSVLDLADDAASAADRARLEQDAAIERARANAVVADYLDADVVLSGAGSEKDRARVSAAFDVASAASAVLKAALPDERRRQDVRRDLVGVQKDLAALDATMDAVDRELDALRRRRAEDLERLGPLRRAADGLAHLRAEQVAVETVGRVVEQFGAAEEQGRRADSAYLRASESFLDLKERWLDLLRLRLEQSAEELAERLEDGEPCPVCGSPEHPAPVASPGGDRVTLGQEQEARRRQAEAEAALQEARGVRDAVRLEIADLAARGGDRSADDVEAAVLDARVRLQEAEAAQAEGVSVEERVALAAEEEERLRVRQDVARAERSDAEARQGSLADQDRLLSRRIDELRAGAASLAVRTAEVESAARDLDAVRRATEGCDRAGAMLEASRARLLGALSGTPFDDAEEARTALMPDALLARTRTSVADHEVQGHRLDAAWEDDEITQGLRDEADGLAAPTEDDERAARSAAVELRTRAHRAGITAEVLGHSVTQLEAYALQLARIEERIAPLRERAQLTSSIAETARGGGDNLYKMSLATYVLASRLEQVAAAATERLLEMSDGRYQLVHSDATAGNKRSGLGLNVVDGWTGNRRDTSTLSGGESFMASLALALGLADVVQQEAGGLDIETLFVDEGFGSLDDQALEQVMDALEGLRSGGRVVGLVSHVPELKQRVSAQLQVVKGRQGSSLRFVEQPVSV